MIDVEHYLEQGFFHAKHFFDPGEVKQIRLDAKRIFVTQLERLSLIEPGDEDEDRFTDALYRCFELNPQIVFNCGKQVQHLISLHRLSLSERLLAALIELGVADPAISTRPVLFFNSRRLAQREVYWRVFPHQDWRSMQGSLDSVVVWVPLMTINRELGAIEVSPGSHRQGLLPCSIVDGFGKVDANLAQRLAFEACEVELGDAIFFSSLLVHQSGTNLTNRIRWSCHFRYNNLQDPSFIARGYPHAYIYRPIEDLITEGFPSPEDVAKLFSAPSRGS